MVLFMRGNDSSSWVRYDELINKQSMGDIFPIANNTDVGEYTYNLNNGANW